MKQSLLYFSFVLFETNAILHSPSHAYVRQLGVSAGEYNLTGGYMPRQGDLFTKFGRAESLSAALFDVFNFAVFNPTIAALPDEMKTIHPDAYWVLYAKHIMPQCETLGRTEEYPEFPDGGVGTMFILDRNLKALGHGQLNPDSMDCRLVNVGDQVLTSCQEEAGRNGRWKITGLEIKPVTSEGNDFQFQAVKSHYHFENTSSSEHVSDCPPKNTGAIVYQNKTLYLLMEAKDGEVDGPFSRFGGSSASSMLDARRGSPSSPPPAYHNSIHPLYLWETDEFLGVGHLHGGPSGGTFWGSHYVHVFFLMSGKPPFNFRKISEEFCMPSVHPRHRHECETIQYIVGLVRDPEDPGTLLVTYGVNDCESAFVRLKLQDVLDSLSDFSDNSTSKMRNFNLTLSD